MKNDQVIDLDYTRPKGTFCGLVGSDAGKCTCCRKHKPLSANGYCASCNTNKAVDPLGYCPKENCTKD